VAEDVAIATAVLGVAEGAVLAEPNSMPEPGTPNNDPHSRLADGREKQQESDAEQGNSTHSERRGATEGIDQAQNPLKGTTKR
jgi:hypothetical protein